MPNEAINQYRRTRDRLEAALQELRPRMQAWMDAHETGDLTIADLAQLEGLHGEREQIAAKLTAANNLLMDALRRRASLDPLTGH